MVEGTVPGSFILLPAIVDMDYHMRRSPKSWPCPRPQFARPKAEFCVDSASSLARRVENKLGDKRPPFFVHTMLGNSEDVHAVSSRVHQASTPSFSISSESVPLDHSRHLFSNQAQRSSVTLREVASNESRETSNPVLPFVVSFHSLDASFGKNSVRATTNGKPPWKCFAVIL